MTMKTTPDRGDRGSVLMMALLSITILTLICATSLYIASQNTNSGMQTAAWQQSLTAAESGVDAAVRALNTGTWTTVNASGSPVPWKTVSTATLPTTEPSSGTGSNATAKPTTSQYNYLPSSALSLTIQGEGAPTVSAWVTIDTAGGLSDSTGSWYRIRSSGQTTFQSNSIFKRVSNNRLDSDLRNTITMNFNRKGASNVGPSRTIEVIMQPIPQGGNAKGITTENWLQMTGGGSADSFSSPTGQWSLAYRDASYPLMVAEGATGNSAKFANTGQTYVYGGVAYSGTAPKNVNASGPPPDVMGQVSTPANVNLPTPTDPTPISGQSGHYSWTYQNPWSGVTTTYNNLNSVATYTGGGGLPKNGGNAVTSITAAGTASSPGLFIISGDFTVPGGTTFTINPTTTGNPPVADSTNSYVIIWVKGKFTTSGSGLITQVSGTNVKWIIDNDITVSGDSYSNQNGTASTDTFIGVGTNNKFTDSGSGTFTGTVDAPGYDGTISGSGDYTGAFAGSTLTISGSGSFHYDESLSGGGSPSVGNYAFASWFEDNSDPTHKDVNGNYVVY
jgi:Tfp pilus assembly protein PilX